jgi:hypothetical protein
LLIRIRVDPGLKFENDRYSLLWLHRKVFFDIRRLGRLKAIEFADHMLHSSILQVPGLLRGSRFNLVSAGGRSRFGELEPVIGSQESINP